MSDQRASVAKSVIDSAMDSTFIMDSRGEIQGMLAYQAVDHGILTPVDPAIFKAQKGTDPYEPVIIEALNSPQY